ncbi:MAG: glycosyltransferase family 2 protein [Lactobacillus amylovorus]|nr:glycosyltransferase family 2 protein [Lactobacillus amylovorus]
MKGKINVREHKTISVDCVIVTYNRLELLKECIQAVENQSYPVNKVFVIDNNSSDDTWDYLRKSMTRYRNIVPIHLTKNVGGAGGFNQGIKCFMKESLSEYVWIMDDDTIPNEDALLNLIKQLNVTNNVGFWASNVRWRDNSPAKMNIPKASENWNEFIEQGLTEVDYASFVSIVIPRKVVQKVGYPVSDFFIWGDDVEYTSRVRKKGYKGFLVKDSIVEHRIKDNIATDIIAEKDKNRIKRYYFANRNNLYNAKKYASKTEYMNTLLHQFLVDPAKIIVSSRNYKLLRLSVNIKGNLAGVFFKPKIEKYNGGMKK